MPAFVLLAIFSLVSCGICNVCLLFVLTMTGAATSMMASSSASAATLPQYSCDLSSTMRERKEMKQWIDDSKPLHLYYKGDHWSALKQVMFCMIFFVANAISSVMFCFSEVHFSMYSKFCDLSSPLREKHTVDDRGVRSHFPTDRQQHPHHRVEGSHALHSR